MTNREKYEKEILDIACSGHSLALNKSGKICACNNIRCDECKFYDSVINCGILIKEWSEQEYEEPKINLPQDIKVDTPILVSDNKREWYKRHFAKFMDGKVKVGVWWDGHTSWTVDTSNDITYWMYAKLPESEME